MELRHLRYFIAVAEKWTRDGRLTGFMWTLVSCFSSSWWTQRRLSSQASM
jgi:hypothetical protein